MYNYTFISLSRKYNPYGNEFSCRERLIYTYEYTIKRKKSNRYKIHGSDNHKHLNIEQLSDFVNNHLLKDETKVDYTETYFDIYGLVSPPVLSLLYYLWADSNYLFDKYIDTNEILRKVYHTHWGSLGSNKYNSMGTALFTLGILDKIIPAMFLKETQEDKNLVRQSTGPSAYFNRSYPRFKDIFKKFGELFPKEMDQYLYSYGGNYNNYGRDYIKEKKKNG